MAAHRDTDLLLELVVGVEEDDLLDAATFHAALVPAYCADLSLQLTVRRRYSDASAAVRLAGPGRERIFAGSAFSLLLIGQLAAITPVYGEDGRDFCLLEAGYEVREINNSECAKLDGGMSCLSLRF